MRLRTAILCMIPGAAHVDLGRALRGLIYFALFAGLANAALIGPLLGWERSVRLGAGLAAAGTWILALWDAVRLAARLRREAQERGGEGAPFRPPEAPQATAAKDIHA
jgi:hypothetical protein